MKHLRVTFFFICLFISFSIQAQQNHFIYVQTDNKQPFYIKLDKKIYSSSSSGYLIVPKLKEGVYNFIVGFPKNEWAEQNIKCTVGDKDLGYLLKNFGDKGWGFFNLQSLYIVMADNNAKSPEVVADVKSDTFSNMLSTVVGDSTIKQNDPVKQEEKKVVPAKVNDETKAMQATVKDKTDEISRAALPVNVSSVIKMLTNKTAGGMEMVYLDTANGSSDTIRVFIPADKDTDKNLRSKRDTQVAAAMQPVTEEKKQEVKFLPIELPNPNTTANPNKPDSVAEPAVSKPPMINSDCKNFATDEDFLKLRKKMAAADNADDMVRMAKKAFKVKCFTTAQLKNLSVLFLKDADKYDFFDAAYPFVSDSQNYELLQNQLTDTYYINRFKVMIRH